MEESNKILTSGDTSVEAWVKVSNTLKKKPRIWNADMNMNAFILKFLELQDKRYTLIEKVLNLVEVYKPMLEQAEPIHILYSGNT